MGDNNKDISNVENFFSMTKKKKKVSGKKFHGNQFSDTCIEEATVAISTIQVSSSSIEETSETTMPMMKKKKKKKEQEENNIYIESINDNHNDCWVFASQQERDYTYEEMLERVYKIMKLKNPETASGQCETLRLRPPQVVRIGTRRTGFVNFVEICTIIHRQAQHVMAYILTELGTTGSIDGQNQLIIKGILTVKQVEAILRHYIKEYVVCKTCHSPKTLLVKENRIFYIDCEICNARCSVATIISGFRAVTVKRTKLRQM